MIPYDFRREAFERGEGGSTPSNTILTNGTIDRCARREDDEEPVEIEVK